LRVKSNLKDKPFVLYFVFGISSLLAYYGANAVGMSVLSSVILGGSLTYAINKACENFESYSTGLVFAAVLLVAAFFHLVVWEPLLADYYSITGWFESFDPVRIYIYSRELVKNDFVPIILWDFSGTFYVYGLFLYLFTFDPIIVLFVQLFFLISGLTHLRKALVATKVFKSPRWANSVYLTLLIPEVIFYATMPTKDFCMLIIFTYFLSFLLRYFYLDEKKFRNLMFIVLLVLLGAFVRGSALFFLLGAAVLPRYFEGGIGRRTRNILLSAAMVVSSLLLVATLTSWDMIEYLAGKNSTALAHASDDDGFSENSIAQLFLTDNSFLKIFFIPIRNVFLLISPLSKTPGLSPFSYSFNQWLDFVVFFSSLAYGVALPVITAVIQSAFSNKNSAAFRCVVVVFAFWFTATANGVQIFHPRYRIMISSVLIVAIFLGLQSGRKVLLSHYYGWSVLALFGVAGFILLKSGIF
jgi:hypothetical protein